MRASLYVRHVSRRARGASLQFNFSLRDLFESFRIPLTFECLHASFEGFDCIALEDGALLLQKDFPGVHSIVDDMDGHARLLLARGDHEVMGVSAGVTGQE